MGRMTSAASNKSEDKILEPETRLRELEHRLTHYLHRIITWDEVGIRCAVR